MTCERMNGRFVRTARLGRMLRAAASAPGRLPARLLHPELVSFVLFAALSRLDRRGVVRGIDGIIDVGANIGQFAFMASRVWPNVPIYSFEPDPALFPQLVRTFQRFGIRGHCFPHAAAEAAGERELFRYHPHTANSLLARSDGLTAAPPCQVETVALDEIRDQFGRAECMYLKLDVQGGELAALQGARQLMSIVGYVQVEVSMESPYRAGGTAGSVLSFLERAGFRLHEILDELRSPDTDALKEMDWLFTRSEPDGPGTALIP
jgi:FkbM family methyltransferase